MRWLDIFPFCCFLLQFLIVNASIPQESLSEDPSFEQVFNPLAESLNASFYQNIPECPYHVAKIILTLKSKNLIQSVFLLCTNVFLMS